MAITSSAFQSKVENLAKTIKPNPQDAFAFVVQHLGAEDRPVAPLVTYAAGSLERVEQSIGYLYDCTKDTNCVEVPAEIFKQLVAKLYSEFYRTISNDTKLTETGSYAFSLVSSNWQEELRLNRTHSAQVLSRAIQILPDGLAKTQLAHRLSITRI